MTWGDYRYVGAEAAEGDGETRKRAQWQRTPRVASAVVTVATNGKAVSVPLNGSDGLKLVASVRAVPDTDVAGDGSGRLVPAGTKAVSVFLVNDREPAEEEQRRSEAMVFQAGLQYQQHEATGPYLLRDPLDPDLDQATKSERQLRAHRSMRDVEPSAPLWVKRSGGTAVPQEAE